jgi:hypothetical protein
MTRSLLLLAGALALVLTGPAAAQAKKPTTSSSKKLYRWVDADGKVQVSDTLPPEAVDKARREINAKSGATTGSVDRELTPQERIEQALAAKQQAAESAILAQQQRDEDAMLNSYLTEADLQRAYGERISLLKQTLESTDVSLLSLRESLALQLASASDAELIGRKVPEKQLGTIRELHNELIKQRQFQSNRHRELLALDAEYVRVLERFRARRAEQAAEATRAAGQ